MSLLWALRWQLVGRESTGSVLDTDSVTHALVLMCRGGYLPQAFVITLLPFAALLIAGVGDVMWRSRPIRSVPARASSWRRWCAQVASRSGVVVVTAGALVFAVWGAPGWASAMRTAATENPGAYSVQATEWIMRNIPRHTTIAVDDNIWGT